MPGSMATMAAKKKVTLEDLHGETVIATKRGISPYFDPIGMTWNITTRRSS